MQSSEQMLVLASQSPRRKELLERSGFQFTVASLEISEILKENLSLPDQIRDLARRKASALAQSWRADGLPESLKRNKYMNKQGLLLLAADTVVVLDESVLGKPKDLAESEQHIRRLSGRSHRVITAVCLLELNERLDEGRVAVAHEWADVVFKNLDDATINEYVAGGEGLDKAGAYGAQGEGVRLIERLDGALDCVMGLPVALVESMLKQNEWLVARSR